MGSKGKVLRSEVPGNVPGSKAVYEKAIDSTGKTKSYLKTTFDNQGKIPHIKDKITGEVFNLGK